LDAKLNFAPGRFPSGDKSPQKCRPVLYRVYERMMKETTILSQGHARQLQMRNKHRLGIWNIRSMLQLGKVQLGLLGEEMMRLGVDICGLSEVRWDGQRHFTTLDGHSIVYSGRPTQGMSGVAVWIHRKITGALVGYEPISDRVLMCRATQRETTKHYSDSTVWTNDSSHG